MKHKNPKFVLPETLKKAKIIVVKEEVNKSTFIVKNSTPASQHLIGLDRKSANLITTKEFEFVM